MSDVFSILVVKSSTEKSCDKDSQKLHQYLFDRQILIYEGTLLKPGPRSIDIIEPHPELSLEEQANIKKFCYENNFDLPKPFSHFEVSHNIVEFLIKRSIFSEAECAEFHLICKNCKAGFNGFESPVVELLNEFHHGIDSSFECAHCKRSELLRLCDTTGFAAGFLAVQFWNWGSLNEKFAIQVAADLNFEVTRIFGKL